MSVGSRLREALRTTPYRFQVQGVRFIEESEGRALVADDMGLGKTLQAIGYAAIHPELRPTVVVCPATIKYNWQREWKKHAGLKSYVVDGGYSTEADDKIQLRKRLRKLSKKRDRRKRFAAIRAAKQAYRLRRKKIKETLREVKRHKILILNYDIVDTWIPILSKLGVQLLILDECHYIKNRKAKRTKACKELSSASEQVVGLSGTPIAGVPAEFFPILNMIRPDEFDSFWTYAFKFCNPVKSRWGGGWDFSGTSNLEALHKRLQGIMIRRLKGQVLKHLPKKTRTVIPLDITNRKVYTKAEEDFLAWLLKRRGEDAWKRAQRAETIVRLNALKFLAAEGKLKTAIQWITDWLEETNEKLIVFATHRKILKLLHKTFPKAVRIDGSVTGKARQQAVDKFQEDKSCRLFLGHLKAAGQGITLTAAYNVLFLEVGWTPGEHDQAEDRALRIGQTKHVNVYYLVGRNTVEEKILSIIEAKGHVVGEILDGKKGGTMNLLSAFLEAVA